MPHASQTMKEDIKEGKETYMAIFKLSQLLNPGIDNDETLSIYIHLCELGINPETLASCIRQLQREVAGLKEHNENSQKDDVANRNN